MKNYYVYMLKCADNSYYVGFTNNLEKRVAEHENKQGSFYTACRLPIKVVFVQDFATKDEAFVVERQIKQWTRKKKEALICQDWRTLKNLSRKVSKKIG